MMSMARRGSFSRSARSIGYWIAGLAFMLSILSCRAREPLVIGFAASLSGKDYVLGVEGRNAAELFVKEANAAGGVGGRQLRLDVRDLASDAGRVRSETKALIDSGLPLIVGYYTSAAAAAALEVPEADRAVLVSPSATSDSLDGKVDALFRTIMSSRKDASILLSDMKARGLGTLVVLAYAGNEPYAETYVKPLRGRIAIAADIRFDSIADIDYEALRRLREPAVPGAAGSPGYDAVLIIASPLDSGTIAQELAIKGLSAPLYVSGWAGTDDLITYGGAAVEGTVFVHQADGSLPGVAELALRYKAAYKADPGYGAMQTWDAMLFVRAAIEAARGDEAAIGAAVRSIRVFEGISGPVSIDAFGDASRAVYLKRVEGGRIVVIGRAD